MILVLNVTDSDKGSWQIVENNKIVLSYEFVMVRGEDTILLHLDRFLNKHKLSLADIKKFILLVKEASLTQVKIFTTIANTLAWHFDWPIVADYYFKGDSVKVLDRLIKKLSKIRKFKAVSAKYKRKAEITISKKKAKYKISK